MVPPLVSVVGFLVLIIGSMGYMGVFGMDEAVSYVLMVLGLIAVIGGMAVMMYRNGSSESDTEEEQEMGFIEKLKNAFKKKDKGEVKEAKPKAEAKKAAPAGKMVDQFKGEGKVADALRFAAAKIDLKMEAGMSEKTAAIFMGGLKAVEADTADDDAKLVAISQIIGGIVNA